MLNDSKPLHARNADEDFVPSSDIAVQGRGSIWTSVGEWVVLTPISDRATRLYWLLRAHVNHTRTLADGSRDHRAWPTQERLAGMLGVSKRQTVAAALAELVGVGAVDVTPERYAGGLRQRNVYTVHLDPPEGFGGHRSVTDAHRALNPAKLEKPQVKPTSVPADVRASAPADSNQTKVNQTKSKSSPPVRHRSADRRRTPSEAEVRRVNRQERRAWELPDDPTWKTLADDELAEFVVEHVESRYGLGPGSEPMIYDMACRGERPEYVMNAALQREREAQGYAADNPLPGYLTDYDAWAADRPSRVAAAADPWAS